MPLSISHQLKPQVSTASPAAQVAQPAGGVNSTEILKGEKTVAIHHNGLIYHLQATRLGKLILTK